MRACAHIYVITDVTWGMSFFKWLIRFSCFWDPVHVFTWLASCACFKLSTTYSECIRMCTFLFCLSWMRNWLHVMIPWTTSSETWLHSSPDVVTLFSFASPFQTYVSTRFISLILLHGTRMLCRHKYRSQGNNTSIHTYWILPHLYILAQECPLHIILLQWLVELHR